MGDYILFDESSRGIHGEKLKSRYSGPCVVTGVHKADISCKHIVTAKQKVFHMDDVKMFIGSREEAYKAAKTDDDQYVIKEIIDYKGDPDTRSFMHFLVLFEDDDEVWLQYNTDLALTSQFESYCKCNPELEPLTMSEKEWRARNSDYNSRGMIGVAPGIECFVNLKAW